METVTDLKLAINEHGKGFVVEYINFNDEEFPDYKDLIEDALEFKYISFEDKEPGVYLATVLELKGDAIDKIMFDIKVGMSLE